MDNEWLARYREHNDALARRLTMDKPGDRSGAYAPAQERSAEVRNPYFQHDNALQPEITDVQIAKLFVSRIHKIAVQVQDSALRTQLYELADDIEERLSR